MLVGFWVKEDERVFDDMLWLVQHVRQTLVKTGGVVEWEYGMKELLPEFVKVSPEEVLKILRAYLIGGTKNHGE